MGIRSLPLALVVAWMLPSALQACNCESAYAPCHEAAQSDAIFIGKVLSIDPISLNLWHMAKPASLRVLNDAYASAQQNPTAESLARLKSTYLDTFPDLNKDTRDRMSAAKSLSEVTSLFYQELRHGMRVHLQVKAFFKRDDDDADDDDADATFDVWTPFGDCGIDFQTGETYLVYASEDDEGTGTYSTGSCTRTRRLSDAGADLAYLFFLKDHAEESAQLEGFTTTNELYERTLDSLHDPASVPPPVPAVVVELRSLALARYATADAAGRFVFDGLAEGEYQISAYAPGYPLTSRLLTTPRPVHVEEKSCTRQILLLPRN